MAPTVKTPAGLGVRRDRTVQEYEPDSYKLQGKLKGPTVCPRVRRRTVRSPEAGTMTPQALFARHLL